MPIPKGWRQVPKDPKRHYIAPDGTIHTREETENVFARSLGFRNNKQYKTESAKLGPKLRQSQRYQKAMTAGRGAGLAPKEVRLFAIAMATSKDNSPGGPKAQWLAAIGRRDLTADYAVGETPSVMN